MHPLGRPVLPDVKKMCEMDLPSPGASLLQSSSAAAAAEEEEQEEEDEEEEEA